MNTILQQSRHTAAHGEAPDVNCRNLRARWRCFLTVALILGVAPQLARAALIQVPNASFESPPTAFVDITVDSWQKSPKPDGYDESGGSFWAQLAGVFLNVAPTNSAYIDNSDGAQGLYLFADPQLAVYQDYNTIGGTNSSPSHEFDAVFEPGKTYDLTVGVIGGGGGMLEGTTLELTCTTWTPTATA